MAKSMKRKRRAHAAADNFIAYNKLTNKDRRFFNSAHLHLYLQNAYKQMFPKRDVLKRPLTGAHSPYSRADLRYINARIKYALELVGQYDNARFGKTAAMQHAYFRRRYDREVFFTHLFKSIQEHKKKVISARHAEAEGIAIFNDGYLDLEALRDAKDIFPKIGGVALTESHIYAASVFYAVNFVLDALEMNDAARVSRLVANMFHFGRGTSYEAAHGKKGGKKNMEQWAIRKEKAYKLFQRHDIYNKYGPKHEAMLSALGPILVKNKVRVSPETLKTKWLRAFVNRAKSSL